jgi:hypothetical protein
MQEWMFSFAAISMPAAEDEEEGKATETKTKKIQKKRLLSSYDTIMYSYS